MLNLSQEDKETAQSKEIKEYKDFNQIVQKINNLASEKASKHLQEAK